MTWSILLWRKQTIVTFQNGADFEQTHQQHRQPIFSISCLGTCAGCSQTHKTAKDWSGKHLLVNAKTLNMLVKSVQNRSISSEICPENSHKIGYYLPIVLWRMKPRKFPRNSHQTGWFFQESLKIPQNLAFFSATYQKHCMDGWLSSSFYFYNTQSSQ